MHRDVIRSAKRDKNYRLFLNPKEIQSLYTYKALLREVIDGDTLWVQVDCGFERWTRQKIRLRGIDALELDTHLGRKAKAFVEDRLPVKSTVVIKTYQSDKYDRY